MDGPSDPNHCRGIQMKIAIFHYGRYCSSIQFASSIFLTRTRASRLCKRACSWQKRSVRYHSHWVRLSTSSRSSIRKSGCTYCGQAQIGDRMADEVRRVSLISWIVLIWPLHLDAPIRFQATVCLLTYLTIESPSREHLLNTLIDVGVLRDSLIGKRFIGRRVAGISHRYGHCSLANGNQI